MRYIKQLEKEAKHGNIDAKKKYKIIMESLETMNHDKVANCIITMKKLIPELDNQSALLIKKYVIEPDRSLDFLSRDEVELINFLRKNLK